MAWRLSKIAGVLFGSPIERTPARRQRNPLIKMFARNASHRAYKLGMIIHRPMLLAIRRHYYPTVQFVIVFYQDLLRNRTLDLQIAPSPWSKYTNSLPAASIRILYLIIYHISYFFLVYIFFSSSMSILLQYLMQSPFYSVVDIEIYIYIYIYFFVSVRTHWWLGPRG